MLRHDIQERMDVGSPVSSPCVAALAPFLCLADTSRKDWRSNLPWTKRRLTACLVWWILWTKNRSRARGVYERGATARGCGHRCFTTCPRSKLVVMPDHWSGNFFLKETKYKASCTVCSVLFFSRLVTMVIKSCSPMPPSCSDGRSCCCTEHAEICSQPV